MRPAIIALLVLSTALTSLAQVLYKFALRSGSLDPVWLLAGLACYGVSAAVFVFVLRSADVSVAYPVFATSYIWVGMLAYGFLGEPFYTATKISGTLLVTFGVALVGVGSRRKHG